MNFLTKTLTQRYLLAVLQSLPQTALALLSTWAH